LLARLRILNLEVPEHNYLIQVAQASNF